MSNDDTRQTVSSSRPHLGNTEMCIYQFPRPHIILPSTGKTLAWKPHRDRTRRINLTSSEGKRRFVDDGHAIPYFYSSAPVYYRRCLYLLHSSLISLYHCGPRTENTRSRFKICLHFPRFSMWAWCNIIYF